MFECYNGSATVSEGSKGCSWYKKGRMRDVIQYFVPSVTSILIRWLVQRSDGMNFKDILTVKLGKVRSSRGSKERRAACLNIGVFA